MTGHDIQNAMTKAYGISSQPDRYDMETFDFPESLARLQRLLIALLMAMKGGM